MIDAAEISVVIPTHGRPQYLSEAIESVLAQTSAVREIIVVSDDDAPATREVVSRFSRASEVPVRYIDNTSGVGGASSSRNTGARLATGTHLAFLDDDDTWLPSYTTNALEHLNASDGSCVVTWLLMFRDTLEAPGLMIRDGLSAPEVAAINPGFTGSNFIISAASFWSIDGFDEDLRVINDGDFVYRYLSAGHSYVANQRFEVRQRKHSDGQLTAATEMRAQGLETYMRKHRQTLSLRDRRYMRLAINRIRYHAASSQLHKLRYLLAGFVNSSPQSVWISVRGWKQRPLWRA